MAPRYAPRPGRHLVTVLWSAAMPKQVIFVFQCDDSDYFALAKEQNCLERLTEAFGELHWLLRSCVRPSETAAAYFGAAELLSDRDICLLKLQSNGDLECACHAMKPRNGRVAPEQ